MSSFQETAYGGIFCRDGRMLAAGDDAGCVRIFDTESRNMLRLLRNKDDSKETNQHGSAVHRVDFGLCGKKVFSFSDDHIVRMWDLANGRCVQQYNEHEDYVRAGAVNPANENLIASGGYDGKVILYDTRISEVICSLDHGSPVETLLFLPSGGICLSAGGTNILAWDVFRHGKYMTKLSQHHKTITCLRMASNGRRFISGGLDRHLKFYDVVSYQTVHSMDFSNAILSLAVAPEDRSLVVGTVDGIISIQNMEHIIQRENEELEKQQTKMNRARHRFFIGNTNLDSQPNKILPLYQGISCNNVQIDHQIEYSTKDQRLSKYDKLLRSYSYGQSLDSVMVRHIAYRKPEVTIGVMQELIHRKGLHRALAGRSKESLNGIINFICRNLGDIRFTRVLIDVITILIELYESYIPLSLMLQGIQSKANENFVKEDNDDKSQRESCENGTIESNDKEDDIENNPKANKRLKEAKEVKVYNEQNKKDKKPLNHNIEVSSIEYEKTVAQRESNLNDDKLSIEECVLPERSLDIEALDGLNFQLLLQTINREVNLTRRLLETKGVIDMLICASGGCNDAKSTRVEFGTSKNDRTY